MVQQRSAYFKSGGDASERACCQIFFNNSINILDAENDVLRLLIFNVSSDNKIFICNVHEQIYIINNHI